MSDQYFEDMWLALEDELSNFDSFMSSSDFYSQPSSNQDILDTQNQGEESISPSTYEELLHNQDSFPSNEQLHSKNRKERIEAVKELYNQVPTIIQCASLARLHKTASQLYKKGNVKTANKISKVADNAVFKQFNHSQDKDGLQKNIIVEQRDGVKKATVTVNDIDDNWSITKEFNDIFDAIKFFTHPKKDSSNA